MKTIIKTAMCALSLVLMSSCTYKSDDNMARDDKELKNLFAYNVSSKISNFDEQVSKLISYVSGTYISSQYTGTGAEYTIDGFKEVRFLPMAACELYTTDSKYYFSLLYCCIDDYDDKNIGIWNLLVQKCSDEDDTFIPYSSYEEWKNSDKYRGITLI